MTTERSFIVEIAFSGHCGDGSLGNSDANEMAAYVKAVVKNDQPAAASAQALQWFFQKSTIFGFVGFKLFSDREQGIAFLMERISAAWT